jgi:HEAT repeat protein
VTPEPAVTRRAVGVAGHVGDEATARQGLAAADPAVRATALGALERLGVLGDAELHDAFGDPHPAVRRRAAAVAAGHRSIDLRPLLDDTDPAVVEVAAWACGEHEVVDDATLGRLLALAHGDGAGRDALVRESAVAALGAIGDDRGLDAILAATSDRPPIRRRAVLALASFVDPDHPRAQAVGAALAKALEDRDWQVRQAAEDVTAFE